MEATQKQQLPLIDGKGRPLEYRTNRKGVVVRVGVKPDPERTWRILQRAQSPKNK